MINFIINDMLNIVLGTAFILFCIFMVLQINSEINSTRSNIEKAYTLANTVHSAQVFRRTGIDFMRDIDYFEFENNRNLSKPEKQQKKSDFVGDHDLDI